jgi:glycosyltransferase involved in cell wall biosynthesis
MPVYNGEKYIRQAIDSVMQQTYSNFELLLIDDASTDSSVEIIKGYTDPRIRLIRNENNLGISDSRNRGIDLCNTEYIALMDDDDIALPTRLEKEIEFLDKNQDIDVVGGHLRVIDHKGQDMNKQWSVYLNPNYIKAYFLLGNTVANGTALFRKKFVDEHNIRFRNNYYGAEDYRFWVECSLKGKIANIDEIFLYWRTGHNHETGRVNAYNQKEREEAIDKIHTFALEQAGFQLDSEEIYILNKVFKEEGIVESKEVLEKLYKALKTIAKQAHELKLDNVDEIVTMCRKRYGEKVGKALFLWQ